jgi:type II secretory pathway pseudopilin PulG
MRVTMNQDIHNEKGFVLLGSLVILSLIALVASIALTTTFTDIKISSNYKTSIQSFYIAEAGVQHAKAELKTAPFDDVLDGTYGESPGILSFGINTVFANGTYNVKIEDNDDGDDNPEEDNDNIVYVKGTGFLENGSKSSVELKIKKTLIPLPPIPAPITIIGEANVGISDSSDINVDGRDWRLIDDDETGPTGPDTDKYAIALSNIGAGASPQTPAEAIADLDADIQDFQEANFVGTDTASYTESIGLDSGMTSRELQDFVDMAKQVADNSLMVSDVPEFGIQESTSGPHNQITIGSQTIELGSVNNPKITYFNMKPEDNGRVNRMVDFRDDITGSGILIIEGNDLGFREYLSWTGVVIVIGVDVGAGLMGDGSKEQTITGALIVDEQEEDYPDYEEILLTGNVNVHYSSEAVDLAQNLVLDNGAGNITMLTWRQILN